MKVMYKEESENGLSYVVPETEGEFWVLVAAAGDVHILPMMGRAVWSAIIRLNASTPFIRPIQANEFLELQQEYEADPTLGAVAITDDGSLSLQSATAMCLVAIDKGKASFVIKNRDMSTVLSQAKAF